VAGSYFEVDTPPSVPDDPSYFELTRHWGNRAAPIWGQRSEAWQPADRTHKWPLDPGA
jgi:hypothetical protein